MHDHAGNAAPSCIRRMLRRLACALLLAVGCTGYGLACTTVDLQATDGAVVAGRTMEWFQDLHWQVVAVPRGTRLALRAPAALHQPARQTLTRYAFIGVAPGRLLAGTDALVLDGQNTAGLAFSANFLPGDTRYQQVDAGQAQSAIQLGQFGAWALGSLANVAEVRAALPAVRVWSDPALLQGADAATLHFLFTNASGASLVVEYLDGQLQMRDDPVHVLTNAPPFDWQLTHLRQYLDVGVIGQSQARLGHFSIDALGAGASTMALPSDASPPSRLVRMAFLRAHVRQPRNAAEALQTVAHLLNTVDLAAGTVGEHRDGQVVWDTTQWVALKDLGGQRLYLADADHRTAYVSFDLRRLDALRSPARIKLSALPWPRPADVSDLLDPR